ncbi:MAG: transglutaminase domain-containing protein, partial [Gammaproteobacteria bacterium]|nr:transglutaminase domain-containing protein [Gammaproteobacteria bacterium]
MQENTYSRLMKSIASIVLVAFIMFVLEPATKAAHVLHQEYEQNRAAEAREQAGQLAGTLDNVEAALVRLQTEFSAKARLRNADPGLAEQVREALPSYREQLNALDEQVHTDFNATEARLRGKNLPPEILRRHQEAVAAYEQKMQTLLGNLDNIAGIAEESPENIQKLKSAVDRTLEHLQPLLTRGKHAPFDPEQLPFSIPKGEVRSVSLKADEEARGQSSAPPRRESDGVLRIAARSGGNAAEGECAPAPANPEDKCYTAPTEDVQITQEIRDLAATKGGNPVGVYKWVHNNIQFIPAWGSIQGSDMTLKTKSGNAFDTASLLIALLRASDIPARYVHGTVQIPIKKVMNWAGGAEVPEAAVQLLAQGGIPVTAQTQGGKIAFVKMEHV